MESIKRVAAIHDISGYGRCSLTVALPVLSAMGAQCCALPAAYLSSHTGFEGFTFLDMTDQMIPALEHWKALGLHFDAIYSGFLGSAEQMDIVMRAKALFPRAMLMVDPVMGDHGVTYKTYTPEMCRNMTALARRADLIVPNLTEAAIILARPYESAPKTEGEALEWLQALSDGGKRSVVLTGLVLSQGSIGLGWLDAKDSSSGTLQHPFIGGEYHGTGDLFSSVMLGYLLRDRSLAAAADSAARFIGECAALSAGEGTSRNQGVRFEALLGRLV
ncbi:MAG: pyridoxamine kinase [Oscillospiraceae bacterium]|nr:pyridoxamine kinase [Oscillospiraceae bacterium]